MEVSMFVRRRASGANEVAVLNKYLTTQYSAHTVDRNVTEIGFDLFEN